MEKKEKEFGQQRHSLFEKIQEQICSGGTFCFVSCHSSTLYVVRCSKCRQHLCAKCDVEKHRTLFTHKRTYVLDDQMLTLGPCEFVDHAGAIIIIRNINTITILFLALNSSLSYTFIHIFQFLFTSLPAAIIVFLWVL